MNLKTLNDRPNDSPFDIFWAKAQLLLEEFKKVYDRRHGAGAMLRLLVLTLLMLLLLLLLLMMSLSVLPQFCCF